MPSLRKLPVHSSDLLLKRGRDLTVFSVPSQPQSLLEPEIDITTMIQHVPNIEALIGKENDIPDSPSSPPPRKRQRLDHLSQEEKIMRRKLKNRVAAQSARDRKKARMTELEDQVTLLEQQRQLLQIENQDLRNKNSELEVQNAELRLRLAICENKTSEVKDVSDSQSNDLAVTDGAESSNDKEGGSLEYASLISGPLLKEQDTQLLSLWMMRFVYLPVIARMLTFLMFLNVAAASYCSAMTSTPSSSKEEKSPWLNDPKGKWWGAHQKAWNPSKN